MGLKFNLQISKETSDAAAQGRKGPSMLEPGQYELTLVEAKDFGVDKKDEDWRSAGLTFQHANGAKTWATIKFPVKGNGLWGAEGSDRPLRDLLSFFRAIGIADLENVGETISAVFGDLEKLQSAGVTCGVKVGYEKGKYHLKYVSKGNVQIVSHEDIPMTDADGAPLTFASFDDARETAKERNIQTSPARVVAYVGQQENAAALRKLFAKKAVPPKASLDEGGDLPF